LSALAIPLRNLSVRIPAARIVLVVLVVVPLVFGGWLLLRDSSLVNVRQVEIVGLSGYYDHAARAALTDEALLMTTMHPDSDRLVSTLGQYVDVADLRVDSDFPHGLKISVDVRRAVATTRVGGRRVALAADGLVLATARDANLLPRFGLDSGTITDGQVSGSYQLAILQVLGAAPDVFGRRVKSARYGARGLTLVLNDGPILIFGDAKNAANKWKAAVAVLASPSTHGARYVDVRIAERPAVGGLGAAPVTVKPVPPTPQVAAVQQPAPSAAAGAPGAIAPIQAAPQQAPVNAQPQSGAVPVTP